MKTLNVRKLIAAIAGAALIALPLTGTAVSNHAGEGNWPCLRLASFSNVQQ